MKSRIVLSVMFIGAKVMASNHITIDPGELRSLVHEMVLEILDDLADNTDPDAGLSFKPEVAEYLHRYMQDRPKGTPIRDVIQELGLDA
jgi:hypothetical protein